MACIGSSTRLCARRVHEKLLCQFGQSAPVKKKLTTYVRIKSSSARILNNQTIAPSELVSSNTTTNNNVRNTKHVQIDNIISNTEFKTSTSSSVASLNNINYDNSNLIIDNSNSNNNNNTNHTSNYILNSNLWWHPRQRPDQVWTTNILSNHHQHRGDVAGANGGGIVRRYMSTMRSTQQPSSLPEYQVNPYRLIDDDLKEIYDDIRLLIRKNTNNEELHAIGTYYFDGQGKAFRPMVVILMSRALNRHMNKEKSILPAQKEVSMIAEMIHIASLIHDDVIDQAELRRGKPSANVIWNHKKVAMAGDFILAVASMMIARLKNDDVTLVLSEVITDLIQGEFMQLGSKETENERFAHYLTKTYRKTASLIANSLKSVAILAQADEQTCELAYQYGRNLGLAFQLVDDMLDFVSSSEEMGKPTAADLKLGLATAPVLFACEKYPELTPMIMRRFAEQGDCERAFELVHKSQGLKQTQFLAQQHCMEAARLANTISPSPHQKALVLITDFVLNRMK